MLGKFQWENEENGIMVQKAWPIWKNFYTLDQKNFEALKYYLLIT